MPYGTRLNGAEGFAMLRQAIVIKTGRPSYFIKPNGLFLGM